SRAPPSAGRQTHAPRGALANGMPTSSKEADFRCEPAVEPTRLALLSLLDALRVGSELRVEALDVDPVVGRTIVLERRESLHEQVARTASAAALEAQMERRRHLNECAEEFLFAILGAVPEILPDLVRVEVRTAIEKRHPPLERIAHRLSESSIHGGVASMRFARKGWRVASASFISQATRRYEKCPF